ncbi:MAG: peptidylprolyl isomerase [Bdellovibrionota bacterium]
MKAFLLSSLALLTLISAGSGTEAFATPVLLDRLEASVNSALILNSDVRRFRDTEKLRSQLDPLFAGTDLASKGPAATDAEIVQFLIDEKLITQQFPATDGEVEQEINSIQSNNHIAREQLKSALAQQGYSFEDYFELIRTSASKRALIDRDIRTKVSVSDDDVKNYYFNHYAAKGGAGFRTYSMQMISITIKNFKTQTAAKETAARALKEIRGGEAFEEVSKRLSDAPTASTGGDLGTLTEDQMSPVIRDQVKNMKIGDVSEVFGGQPAGAFYILKLVDLKTDESAHLEKVKEEIRNQLVASEYQHQISLWHERQRQTAFIHRAGEPATAGLPASR